MILRSAPAFLSLVIISAAASPVAAQHGCSESVPRVHKNVIIFVTDGLRRGSVTKHETPTLERIREEGVDFENSHALFPTFTTANASAFATGHALGDTGDFSNVIWTGDTVPFLEHDRILGDLYKRGGYMPQKTLIDAACEAGYNTALIGKEGPTAIQAISQISPTDGQFPVPKSIIIDDETGSFDESGLKGPPVSKDYFEDFQKAGVSLLAPERASNTRADNGYSGTNKIPGTFSANLTQLSYFTSVLTQVVLPAFQKDFMKHNRPFVIVFWSRDPDGTQHFQGDSLNDITTGINGPTSRSAVKNVDRALEQILKWVDIYGMTDYTDFIVVADHGFSTISKHPLDAHQSLFASSCSIEVTYADTNPGFLPWGFLAIDIAAHFHKQLYDPDAPMKGTYKPLFPKRGSACASLQTHPSRGNGLIAGSDPLNVGDERSADLIIAANGGSDLIYMPQAGKPDGISIVDLCDFLSRQNYVDGLFVDEAQFKDVPLPLGTLSMGEIGLTGRATLPKPAVVVNFKSFSLKNHDSKVRVQNMIEIADSGLQQGQGMHGSFSRADTWNNMAAIGPDFRSHYIDHKPVSNMDVADTVVELLGLPHLDEPHGRNIEEARYEDPLLQLFRGRPPKPDVSYGISVSSPSSSGRRTVLLYQMVGEEKYYDEACFTSRSELSSQTSRAPIPNPCF